ncbi:hypothetical protein ABZ863_07730 [Saccharomonospora sp. NPDC046836]|uniref:hypothetical protein n=1 Tax=Saccharomonospora sp. NPDC046836 TaxID=3156921 RepID=UPI00340C6F07
MTSPDVIATLRRIVGTAAPETQALLADEHLRYQFYLDALAATSAAEERVVLTAVLGDNDKVMSEAAVTKHVDRTAGAMGSSSAFTEWARGLSDVFDGVDFTRRRVAEWTLFLRAAEGITPSADDIAAATDWLQRKLATEVSSRDTLELLSSVGRTKRVRNIAADRARKAP